MIVSNSSPLVYLARIEKLFLLHKLFSKIYIPEEVKREVVIEGVKLHRSDAFIIEKEIKKGWIEIQQYKRIISLPFLIDKGELAAISLAKEMNAEMVLIDDKAGRTAAKLVGIEVHGTLFVLLKALKNNCIDFKEFLALLALLSEEGFRVDERVYMTVIQKAQNIIQKTKHEK
jgi:uncharacterized protein